MVSARSIVWGCAGTWASLSWRLLVGVGVLDGFKTVKRK